MKYKNREEEAYDKMYELLDQYGLQVVLKTLADSLENLIKKRGKSIEGLLILETLKGIHAGYCRRHEKDEKEDF